MAELKVKEDLSRMEGTYGAEMIGKLKKMKIFLSGLKGLGIETAKNLVLAGPHTVTLHDDGIASIEDLGANFYLTPESVGKSRGESVLPHFVDLNPNVNTNLHTGAITEELLAGFNVVVVTDDTPKAELQKYNAFCRSKGIVFMYGYLNGATAGLFTDFGAQHNVFDADGEPVKTLIVEQILNGQEEGSVTIDGNRHLLHSGDHVKFEEVRGMSEPLGKAVTYKREDVVEDINQTHVVKTTKNPKRFLIGNTSKLGEYKGGGIATQVKVMQHLSYSSFEANLTSPVFNPGYMDFQKFGNDAQLHFAQLAMWEFQAKEGRLPKLHDEADAAAVVKLAQEINAKHKELNKAKPNSAVEVEEVSEAIVTKCALYRRTELTALAALFGGILAQEITKQTGKYTPLTQWFHFDAFELLDDKVPENASPIGSRYDHQIAIFGKAFQDKLQAQKLFIVGCGALGCEYMKAVAMTGLGTKGCVTVTDDDTIELSNLSRQFLFRRKHVGKSKSTSAGGAAIEMNPELKDTLKTFEIRVEPKSEDIFSDQFWESLDLVVNALDNNHARMYTDGKCVFYNKPLFESGTLGTKANSAICLPHKTPSYGQGVVAGEDGGIAKCTIRNFPAIILHCIEWAREMFDEWFQHGADTLNALLEDRDSFLEKAAADSIEEPDVLERAKAWMELSSQRSFEQCVKIMFDKFAEYFFKGIKDLTHAFPEDARTIDKDTKADLGPFWKGAKRFPSAAVFDADNEDHLEFVYHGACVMADVFKIPQQSREQTKAFCASLTMPEWAPSNVAIDMSEGDEKKEDGEEEKEVSGDLLEEVNNLRAFLKAADLSKIPKLSPADFEKDDDTNHHIDIIRAATNLRAFNYQIKPTNNQHVRMIAGRIIPAIATTTACITGFIQLELYKYVKGCKLEDFRAATINLATNVFCVENLPDPIKAKTGMDPETYMTCVAIPEGFTVWDKVVVNLPDATLGELFDQFKKQHHGAVIDMLSCGDVVFYSEAIPSQQAKMQARLKQKVIDIHNELIGPVFPADRNYMVLDVTVEDEESGDTGIVPRVQYIFK